MKPNFRNAMAQRRKWPRGSIDWNIWTRAAHQYLLLMRGVPSRDWPYER